MQTTTKEQSKTELVEQVQQFTELVEALLRKGEECVPGLLQSVTEAQVIEAMYVLRGRLSSERLSAGAAKLPATDRELENERRDIAAEARWMDRNERDGVPYGTY